ncbi:hypothetical protein jhhlp_007677 [Lomentospora prolificans]|uniref:LIM zinc-binding domain-containing protein n=1 Tax=Lomentospora prolificans TaxID=41688 RepID=A0A2N3N090_9PEZI|nr:hypothetical protein jhhlp_007677 [Lomentospora prolificans]
MAALPRESAFLPTIKCSTCGRQIEISLMGDHICSESDPQDLPPIPNNSLSPYKENNSGKAERIPPRVDTNAANGGYMRGGQLTPVSTSSGSRSLSPKTPDGRSVGGRANDFFEPTIANEDDSTGSQENRRPGGYGGGFSERDDYDADPLYPSSSPNRKQKSVLQRMNTIAPGPFDVGRRRGTGRNAFPAKDAQDTSGYSGTGYGIDRSNTTASNTSGLSSSNNLNGGFSQRPPRTDGYGGFMNRDDFEPEPFTTNSRSGTFPRPNNPAETPMRTPSAPGPRPDRFKSSEDSQSYILAPDTSRPPPPRKSIVRPNTSGRGGTPSVDLAAEFGIGNPYHTPSASMSSAISSYSQSSNASPPRLPRERLPQGERKPSNTSNIDNLMNDLQASMANMQPSTPQLDRNPSISSSRRGRSRDGRYSSRSRSASRPRQPGPISYDRPTFDLKAEVDRYHTSGLNQSDPRQGRRPDIGNRQTSDGDRRGREMPDAYGSSSLRRGLSRGPGSQASRGICKACGEEIRGKSISSADGRLTGKYHKACFVCTTCQEPFTSAEFYVLDDKPYCELHYHELNGSLCGSCGRGIEGQYLEDEALIKYHVGCFRCADCGMSLSNGYFEVDGKPYCERDAWRRVQQETPAPGGYGMPSDPNLASPISDYAPALAGIISPTTPAFGRQPIGTFPPSPASSRGPPTPIGLPPRPGDKAPSGPPGPPRRPIGLPRGQRLPPGMGPVPRPRMNKRMTRLGMM